MKVRTRKMNGTALPPLTALRKESGAELFEFALILPVLVVLMVGLLDFATAFNLRQKLANAAREGARLGASEPTLDLTQSSPLTVQDIHDAVVTYLQNANVDTSFIGSTMTSAGSFTWTYYSSGSYGLKVERQALIPAGCGSSSTNPCIAATRVTLTYPYNWTFGFNHIITLIGGPALPGTITLPAAGTMQDLVNN